MPARNPEHGVVTVRSSNADLRIRLHGWMQRVREEGFPEPEQEELFHLAGAAGRVRALRALGA